MRQVLAGLACMLLTAYALGQTSTGQMNTGIDRDSESSIAARASALKAEAESSPTGLAMVTLKKYPGHYTMLTVRTRSGGAEMHAETNDIFVVLDGEATEVSGGTIVEPKEISPGETRGVRIEGGTSTPMHKGDMIHIEPNTPHQTILPPGKTLTYYVIKVAARKS
ncbi:MAG: hypothetical protein M3Y50_15340 [Acidobacteriota bacterium]|nr:hypothetical protein [Acidobacteriota bacterium]